MLKFETGSLLLSTISATLLAALLAGCAPSVQKPMPAQSQLDRIAAELQPQTTPGEVPSAVSDLLLGGGTDASTGSQQERFDIAASDVPATRFFLSLMEGTDINIVTDSNLKGSISLNLSDVTIEDVLEICREIYGYDYKISGNTYLISPRELSTQIFHINYLDIKRVGLSDTTVSVGRLESGGNSGNNRNGGNRNNSGGQNDSGLLSLLLGDQQNGQGSASGSSQGARIQTLTRSDFWSELKAFITSMVGGEVDGRKVMVSPQAGMVVVKALPNELHDVRDFLERSELSVQRQVQLEAKIIEVRLNDDYNAGINWNQIGGSLSYNYNNSRTGITTGAFNSVFNIADINSFIDLLGEQGSVQVLSSPKQATLNNQKAVLRVGSDEYFVTDISSDTTTSGTSAVVNSPDIEITPFFSGIALDVTPQISADGDIIMHVHPVITEVRDLIKPIQLGEQTFSFPTAFRDIRESDTIVRAKDGEVVVLGGLMQEVEDHENRRYAGAGDVPLLGRLFRGKTVKVRKSELVILIKPTIIDADSTRREVQRSRERIRELGNEQRRLLKID